MKSLKQFILEGLTMSYPPEFLLRKVKEAFPVKMHMEKKYDKAALDDVGTRLIPSTVHK